MDWREPEAEQTEAEQVDLEAEQEDLEAEQEEDLDAEDLELIAFLEAAANLAAQQEVFDALGLSSYVCWPLAFSLTL